MGSHGCGDVDQPRNCLGGSPVRVSQALVRADARPCRIAGGYARPNLPRSVAVSAVSSQCSCSSFESRSAVSVGLDGGGNYLGHALLERGDVVVQPIVSWMNRVLGRQTADTSTALDQTEPPNAAQAGMPERVTTNRLVIGRAERSEFNAPPDEHDIPLIDIIAVCAYREGSPARVVTDHDRLRGVGLPLNPHPAINHALAHAGESSPRAAASPSALTARRSVRICRARAATLARVCRCEGTLAAARVLADDTSAVEAITRDGDDRVGSDIFGRSTSMLHALWQTVPRHRAAELSSCK